MTGADYLATVRLSDREDRTLAAPGELCERVPAESLAWLLQQGLIEPAPAPLPLESSQPPDEDDA